jgi:hypothetical protein
LARRPQAIVLDDRLLIEQLLTGPPKAGGELYTTTCWYYRACRAAVLGAGGRLSGPFEELESSQQEVAIASLLQLSEDISLPDPRAVVPAMVDVAGRHPRLNLLNLEAVAAASVLAASVWLSQESARGVLPDVLDQERIPWRIIRIR